MVRQAKVISGNPKSTEFASPKSVCRKVSFKNYFFQNSSKTYYKFLGARSNLTGIFFLKEKQKTNFVKVIKFTKG